MQLQSKSGALIAAQKAMLEEELNENTSGMQQYEQIMDNMIWDLNILKWKKVLDGRHVLVGTDLMGYIDLKVGGLWLSVEFDVCGQRAVIWKIFQQVKGSGAIWEETTTGMCKDLAFCIPQLVRARKLCSIFMYPCTQKLHSQLYSTIMHINFNRSHSWSNWPHISCHL